MQTRAHGGEVIGIEGVSLIYRSRNAEVHALDNISFAATDREFVALVGPSGCGKSTLLKLISGLLPHYSGMVRVNGRPISGPTASIGIVFQSPLLMAWRTVLENVLLQVEIRNLRVADYLAAARDLIRLVGLDGFEDAHPHQLSGGMQQRVGLARALAVNPQILLMDEPFGALDEQTRRLLQEQLLQLWEEQRKTVVFVTHSMDEAVMLGDRVMLMTPRPGRVKEMIDVPLQRPRSPQVEKSGAFVEIKEYLWENLRAMQVGAS